MAGRAFSALVIGTDGVIGRALRDHLSKHGDTVYGTSRRFGINQESVFLDLLGSFDEVLRIARGVETAYLCAGVTKSEACEHAVVQSAEINVTRTVRLAEALLHLGVFVVFLSSNAVFAGDMAFKRSAQPYAPQTEYGRQKVECERQLLLLNEGTAIVRLTKVLSVQTPLIQDWIGKLGGGEAIHPFNDLYFSPISVRFVVDVLSNIGRLREPGVYQVSGDRDLSYADFARILAVQMCSNEQLVDPVSFLASGAVPRFTARYSSLDMREVTALLGTSPQPAEDVARDLLQNAIEV